MKKKILIIIGVLILTASVSFIYWFQFMRYVPSFPEEVVDLCARFHKIEGEVSCDEAVSLVSEKFNGAIYDIQFGKTQIIREDLSGIDMRDIWKIKIKLDQIIEFERLGTDADNLELFINRENGAFLKTQIL